MLAARTVPRAPSGGITRQRKWIIHWYSFSNQGIMLTDLQSPVDYHETPSSSCSLLLHHLARRVWPRLPPPPAFPLDDSLQSSLVSDTQETLCHHIHISYISAYSSQGPRLSHPYSTHLVIHIAAQLLVTIRRRLVPPSIPLPLPSPGPRPGIPLVHLQIRHAQ